MLNSYLSQLEFHGELFWKFFFNPNTLENSDAASELCTTEVSSNDFAPKPIPTVEPTAIKAILRTFNQTDMIVSFETKENYTKKIF